MDAAWKCYDFVKRNRGKFLVAGTVTGGVILAQRIYESRHRQLETPHVNHSQIAMARCQYIFDSNHRTCEAKLMELLPTVRNLLENYFNVEYLISMLRSDTLTQAEKVEIWEKLKIMSIARVIAGAYAYGALVHVMKCQMSIVSAGIYTTMQNVASAPRNDGWLSYLPEVISSQFKSSEPELSAEQLSSHTSQEVFLRCIQYFTSAGISQLFESVFKFTSEVVKDVELTRKLTSAELNEMFVRVILRIEQLDLAKFVVPGFGENADLNELLERLVSSIESEKFKDNLRYSMDPFNETAMNCVVSVHGNTEAKPFAKLIPTIADAFFTVVSTDFDSPVQNCICSPELYRLSKEVFNASVELGNANLA